MSVRQEVFNRAWERANEMTHPAVRGTSCSYRSPNGPCLIGAMISDELYHPMLEGKTADHDKIIEILNKSGVQVTGKDRNFLSDIQSCHDIAFDSVRDFGVKNFKKNMMNNLTKIALEYELEVPK